VSKAESEKSPETTAAPAPRKKRGTRFVPLEDAPRPGLSQRSREVLALALSGVALFALLSLATFKMRDLDGPIPFGDMHNLGGSFGYYLAFGFTCSLGYAGWLPFVLLLLGSLLLFVGRGVERLTVKALGAVVFAAMCAILFAGRDGAAGFGDPTPYGAGGRFGAFVSPRLELTCGGTGRILLVGFGALVSLLIATEWMFSDMLLRTIAAIDALRRRLWPRPAAAGADLDAALGDAEAATEPKPRRRRAPKDTAAAAAEGPASPSNDATDDEAGEKSSRGAKAADGSDEADEPDEAEVDGKGGDAAPRSRRGRAAKADRDDDVDDDASDAADERDAGDAENAAPAAKSKEPVPTVPPIPIVVTKLKPPPKPKPKKRPAGQSNLPFDDAYPFPPIELFQESVTTDLGATSEVLNRGGQAIVQKLAHFGIQAEIVAASVGPAVTQYELRLAESIRVNKLTGFESDLAAALKAVSVRVVAPIPGKDTIGVEVPNAERQKVFMRDLLDQFGRSEQHAIPLYLGKDVAGNPIVEDLARMPHLLIAGTTGSGKSVCINTILLSVLMTRTPEQVKLILVDPKMVELQAYKRVPHLCCDVVTNMKKAPGVLQWAVDEMENRYALLSAAGVNHIKNYNRLGQQELQKRLQREPDPERVQLSYVVIVIDEFADLMNVAANEVEELIQRLAQKSRAVGMHVILATQRPSSEVITGIIKANLPCQIAFKVNRRIDSRVILDANGAEKLLGFGDMLYMPPGGGALLRAQGTFVADDEMQAVVRFLEEKGQKPSFTPALVQTQGSSRPSIADSDERYREAVEIILGQQRGSATLLQRALAVGYTRATRLLELMEEDGLVGPFVGSKSRDVLMTLEEYHAREELREAAEAEAGDATGADDGAAEADGDAGEAAPDATAEAGDDDAGGESAPPGEAAAASAGDDGDDEAAR